MSINKKNVRRLYRHIKRVPKKSFHMGRWIKGPANGRPLDQSRAREIISLQESKKTSGHPCGTVGCLAGHAALLAVADGLNKEVNPGTVKEIATEWLGLTHEQAHYLFLAVEAHDSFGTVSSGLLKRRHALRVLKHLHKTEEVDWAAAGTAWS